MGLGHLDVLDPADELAELVAIDDPTVEGDEDLVAGFVDGPVAAELIEGRWGRRLDFVEFELELRVGQLVFTASRHAAREEQEKKGRRQHGSRAGEIVHFD
ncbi:hypothetical protein ACNOYE_27490 [Nannocystaceae bacterium ST9]